MSPMTHPTTSVRQPTWRVLGVLASDTAAVAVYFVTHLALANVTAALAAAGVLPTLWTLFAWSRWGRADYLGLASVAVFVIAIAISVISGGSALPLKVTKASLTGVGGLICLASAALRRPMVGIIMESVSSRRRLRPVGSLGPAGRRRTYPVATVIVGVTALLDATVQLVLAATLSTGSFVALGSIV